MDNVQNVLATGTVPSSAAAAFTAIDPGTEVSQVTVYNANTSAVTLDLYIVKAGTNSGDASNIALTGVDGNAAVFSIAAKGLFNLLDHLEPHIELALGDAVWWLAGTASQLTGYVCGA